MFVTFLKFMENPSVIFMCPLPQKNIGSKLEKVKIRRVEKVADILYLLLFTTIFHIQSFLHKCYIFKNHENCKKFHHFYNLYLSYKG